MTTCVLGLGVQVGGANQRLNNVPSDSWARVGQVELISFLNLLGMSQSRNWVFTLNNPRDTEYPESWTTNHLKLIVYQVEIGEEGTFHLQGYLELDTPRRMSFMKNLAPRAHWEIRKGSRKQALEYVTKKETQLTPPSAFKCGMNASESENGWIQFDSDNYNSSWSTLGLLQTMNGTEQTNSKQKSRLLEIKEALLSNSSSIEDIADNEFDLWVRYYRAFEKYATLKTSPRNHAVDVHVVIGPTGTGKSKWAMDTYKGAYWKQRSKWWDGYFKHETVIIDEFYGWLPFDMLLRLLDRYPMLVETKGGQMQFVAKTIVITSNKSPDNWYSGDCYFEALARRINKWHYIPSLGVHAIYDTYSAFKCSHG